MEEEEEEGVEPGDVAMVLGEVEEEGEQNFVQDWEQLLR